MYTADRRRVVVIGAGRVGSHCAMSLIPGHLVDEIVLIDANKDFAQAQATDLADFSCGMGSGVRVRTGSYRDCDEASFVLVTAGRGRRKGESRLDLLRDTLGVLENIADNLSATSFDGMLVCVTNPVDVAAEYLVRRLSLPASQVVGTGTALDTIRLKRILAAGTMLDVGQIQGFCMGEHGDSSFVAWSHVSVGGVPIEEYVRMRPELEQRVAFAQVQQQIHESGASIIGGKGCTEFGVGSIVTELIVAVSRNEKRILPLSVHLDGQYGEKDICVGTPCVIGKHGVEQVLEVDLRFDEQDLMRRSCAIVRNALPTELMADA